MENFFSSRVGHARTYSSVLLSVTIGKVKAPLAMGSGGDKDKDKHKDIEKYGATTFKGLNRGGF